MGMACYKTPTARFSRKGSRTGDGGNGWTGILSLIYCDPRTQPDVKYPTTRIPRVRDTGDNTMLC